MPAALSGLPGTILLRQLLMSVPARKLGSRRCFRIDSRRFRTTKCAARGAPTDVQTILAQGSLRHTAHTDVSLSAIWPRDAPINVPHFPCTEDCISHSFRKSRTQSLTLAAWSAYGETIALMKKNCPDSPRLLGSSRTHHDMFEFWPRRKRATIGAKARPWFQ